MKGKGVDTAEREVYVLLRELFKAVRFFQQDAVFCEGITLQQFNILDRINEAGFLEMSDLHELLGVEKSTTTRLIAPLLKNGLAIQTPSPRDARALRLSLTNQGQKARGEYWECLRAFLSRLNQALPAGDRAGLLSLLENLSSVLPACCRT